MLLEGLTVPLGLQIGWVAQNTVTTSILCFVALLLNRQFLQTGLLGIWFCIKFISVGRLIGGVLRLTQRGSPLRDVY